MFLAMYSEVSIDRAAQAEVAAQSMRDSLAYFGRAPFKHYTAMLEVLKLSKNGVFDVLIECISSDWPMTRIPVV